MPASSWIELKEEGNEAFKAGQHCKAVEKYEAAVACCPAAADRAVLHSNLSAAFQQLGQPADAVRAAGRSLACDDRPAKAWFRKGKSLLALAALRREASAAGRGQEPEGHPLVADDNDLPRSEFRLCLTAQQSLAEAAEREGGGGKGKEIRALLETARDAAFFDAQRGPVELYTAGVHGIAMRSTRDVDPGELLLCESPVAFAEGSVGSAGEGEEDGDVKRAAWQEAGVRVVQQVLESGERVREWVTELTEWAGDAKTSREKLFCVWDCNGHSVGEIDFRVAEWGKKGAALFVSGSRVNHSCRPNAVQSFCPATGRIQLRSLARIPAGREVFITYCPLHLSKASRRKKLRFDCACDRCTEEADAPAVEDHVAKLHEALASEFDALSQRSDTVKGNSSDWRDRVAQDAGAFEAKALAALGHGSEVTYMATVLKCKLWAERPGGGNAFERLQVYSEQLMPRNWPVVISTNMYQAVHKAHAAADQAHSDAEILGHVNEAFRVHRIAFGSGFDDGDDAVDHFWQRYSAELTWLDIDTLERARMLFSGSA